jgi:hypothetical protein
VRQQGRSCCSRHHGCYRARPALPRAGQYWWVNKELGEETGALRVRAEGSTGPPPSGWEVNVGDNKMAQDNTLACGPPSSGPCRVTLTLAGAAGELRPECGGEYVPVEGAWCSGRQVSALHRLSTALQ